MKTAKILLVAVLTAWPLGLAAQSFQNQTEVSGTPNSGLYGTGLAWGDYDGDGDQDLYVTNWATAVSVPRNALYRNEGSGVFADVAAALGVEVVSNSSAAAWGDYDNDGDLDLYVADFFDQDYLYQNNGEAFVEVGRTGGTVDVERRGSTTSVAWGDYNNDGWLDFYLGEYYYDNELYQNQGDGTFEAQTDLGVNDRRDADDVSWADYDNDGDLDLYVVNREQENALYRNDLSGSTPAFVALTSSPVADKGIGQAAAWGDYDNDGDLDLYVGNVGANTLYRNDGGDIFAEVGAQAGVRQNTGDWITAGVGWADYDGNGYLDLLLANGADRQPQRVVLLANQGNGTFTNASADAGLSAVRGYYTGVGWADYDGNGAPDFYLTNGVTLGSQLFQNSAESQRFIKVRVRGKTHGDAIGAKVRLIDTSTGAAQYRQVLSGPGSSELIFGAPAGPYQVEVRFPGSATAVLRDAVQAGDQLDIEEP